MKVSGLGVVLMVALGLYGCGGGDHEDIKQWMDESSRDLRGRAPPLPELKPFPIISYDANDQMDPFSPGRVEPEKKEGGGGTKPDFDRPREQLENYPLEALHYVGVMSKGKGQSRYALILAEGIVYPAEVGNYLGQNFGRISAITDSEIVLKEIVQDPSGQSTDWVERQATLQLQEGLQEREAKK
jgi:type IV pilus assembly protein PilP